jgi:hypothetical protein
VNALEKILLPGIRGREKASSRLGMNGNGRILTGSSGSKRREVRDERRIRLAIVDPAFRKNPAVSPSLHTDMFVCFTLLYREISSLMDDASFPVPDVVKVQIIQSQI